MDINQEKPLLSVRLMTYNQEPFIARAIESALKQKTDFAYEIVIGDDFSTDRNPEIISSYAEKYPDKIVYLKRPKGGAYDKERQRIGRIYNFYDTVQHCKGKYIALLDGDDFWTDIHKLQKQVDFLENNAQYAFCCHAYSKVDEQGEFIELTDKPILENYPQGLDITLDRFFGHWLTQTVTTVLRKDAFIFDFENYSIINDYVLFYTTLRKHIGFYLPFNAAGYTIQQTGIFAGQGRLRRLEYNYKVKSIVYKNNRDEPMIKTAFITENYKVLKYLTQADSKDTSPKLLRKYSKLLLANTGYSKEAIAFIYKYIIFPPIVRFKMNLRGMLDKQYKKEVLNK